MAVAPHFIYHERLMHYLVFFGRKNCDLTMIAQVPKRNVLVRKSFLGRFYYSLLYQFQDLVENVRFTKHFMSVVNDKHVDFGKIEKLVF